jgi:nucleotide-binding universal stress UspA family protein
MKKILAAVDGSVASIHAAKKALELCDAMKCELTLIHVAPPSVMPGEVAFAPMPDLRAAELSRGANILKDVQKALERSDVKTMNSLGSPAELISDLAHDENFDLVVVGNKGRGAVSRMLLGSVADRLVHICKRPVMVVR